MKVKITVKYHIEIGNEVIECESLEQAERRIKQMSDLDRFLIKTELKGDEIVNQYLIG